MEQADIQNKSISPVVTTGNGKCDLSQMEKLQTCSYCQHSVELIWVHGHYQCPNCKHVVVSCCGDS